MKHINANLCLAWYIFLLVINLLYAVILLFQYLTQPNTTMFILNKTAKKVIHLYILKKQGAHMVHLDI